MNFLCFVSVLFCLHLFSDGSSSFQVVATRARWFQLVPQVSIYVFLSFIHVKITVQRQGPCVTALRTISPLHFPIQLPPGQLPPEHFPPRISPRTIEVISCYHLLYFFIGAVLQSHALFSSSFQNSFL